MKKYFFFTFRTLILKMLRNLFLIPASLKLLSNYPLTLKMKLMLQMSGSIWRKKILNLTPLGSVLIFMIWIRSGASKKKFWVQHWNQWWLNHLSPPFLSIFHMPGWKTNSDKLKIRNCKKFQKLNKLLEKAKIVRMLRSMYFFSLCLILHYTLNYNYD